MTDAGGVQPSPGRVTTFADLRDELERLRITAARGRGKRRLSLQDIAVASGVPRSSLATYLSGATVIPADQLDAIVLAMGVGPAQAAQWAAAWERSMDHHLTRVRPAAAPSDSQASRAVPPSTPAPSGRRRLGAAVVVSAALLVVAGLGIRRLSAVPDPPRNPSTAPVGVAPAPVARPRCLPVTGRWDTHTEPQARSVRRGPVKAGLACKNGHGWSWITLRRPDGGPGPVTGGYGNSDWCLPVTGDWNADGTTTAGMACADRGMLNWALINGFTGSPSFPPFPFGTDACWPVTGDWDGNGTTTVGAACDDHHKIRWYLVNSLTDATPSYPPFLFGSDACWPVTGDWDGKGATTVGAACPTTSGILWRLSNGLTGQPSTEFTFGGADSCRPVTGDWNGDGTTTVGVVCRAGDALRWTLSNANRPDPPTDPPFLLGSAAVYPADGGWIGPPWPTP